MDRLAFCNCLKSFILALAVLIPLHSCDLFADGGDTLSLGVSLRGKQTIISKNGTFELGFFNPNGTNNWYVGIWYAHISEKTIVWVANRETPIKDMPGVFTLSSAGYLTVSDLQGRIIWSSNDTQQTKASSASILDTGNFALFGAQNTSEIVWESFAYPTDTFLPTMKFWKGMKINSWKSSADPAPGPFSAQMNPSPGKKNYFLQYKNGVSYYSTGEWNGSFFATLPGASAYPFLKEEFVVFSPTRMYYKYKITFGAGTQVVKVNRKGELSVYFWINNGWYMVWNQPQSSCDVYGICGAYGVCLTQQNIQSCSCMDGFQPRNSTVWSSQEWWSSGCVRRTPLNCSSINSNGSDSTEGFLQVTDKSLSVAQAVQYAQELTLQACKTACLNNCSCTAFAFTGFNPTVCKLWFGDLLGIQAKLISSEGQPFFIRLAASDVSQLSAQAGRSSSRSRAVALFISIPSGIAVLGALFIGAWFLQRRRRTLLEKFMMDDASTSLRTFTYKELRTATHKFAHELGKGAFGSVFKGTLRDNTLVAVKKLEGYEQAEKQFHAEISTIGNIHHVNLVRLRGFCAEGSKRMLVYEYMQNGSLNSFLSHISKEEERVLDWKTRFGIGLGIARGLLYLHEECRDRIIHCDIKPENILLDSDFSPKVADFGLAKLVGRNFSKVLTTTRGTIGYLAPEWLMGMPITVKVDVYSFGMTLLEIISGRRNNDLGMQESQRYFPAWAAAQIQKGNIIGIVDGRIADKADVEEVRRAAVVSFLCIQEDENARPSMAKVVRILEGKLEGDLEQYERSLQTFIKDHCIY